MLNEKINILLKQPEQAEYSIQFLQVKKRQPDLEEMFGMSFPFLKERFSWPISLMASRYKKFATSNVLKVMVIAPLIGHDQERQEELSLASPIEKP